MADTAVERIRVRVKGRVQGVYYRASTRAQARALGLVGWVRNTADGAVELEAQGAPSALAELVEWCRKGPPAARVATLEREPRAALADAESDFGIRY